VSVDRIHLRTRNVNGLRRDDNMLVHRITLDVNPLRPGVCLFPEKPADEIKHGAGIVALPDRTVPHPPFSRPGIEPDYAAETIREVCGRGAVRA
jgi:hypothetical protein